VSGFLTVCALFLLWSGFISEGDLQRPRAGFLTFLIFRKWNIRTWRIINFINIMRDQAARGGTLTNSETGVSSAWGVHQQ